MLVQFSCAAPGDRSARPLRHAGEIAGNPAILCNRSIPIQQMSLHGVRLGDPASVIRKSRIRIHDQKTGWIICRDGSRYRLQDSAVATLGVWDNRLLARLNIASPADIESRFGKPDSIEKAEPILIYRYSGNGGSISVLWNQREGQLNGVNVSR